MGAAIAATSSKANDWGIIAQATLYKSSDPATPLARLTYGSDGSITDLAGRIHYCSGCTNQLRIKIEVSSGGIKRPGETSWTQQVSTIPNEQVVGAVVNDGVQWNYSYQNLRYNAYVLGYQYDSVTVTGPASATRIR